MELTTFGRGQPRAGGRRFGRANPLITAALVVLLLAGLVLTASAGVFAANGTGTILTGSDVVAAQAQAGTKSIADVAAQANPAVVTISDTEQITAGSANQQNPFGNPGFTPFPGRTQVTRIGSGFIIDSQGHIVTNAHVIAGATQVQVTFADGSNHTAKVVGYDSFQDVGVLQLDLSDGTKIPGTLSFGDSSQVRAGEQVVAIGTPLGEYPNTVSAGVIGATNRSLDTGEGYLLGHLLQHDAPIYEGNSGGPLLNLKGEVVGINTAKAADTSGAGQLSSLQPVNIAFAVESNTAKAIVDQLIATGSVARPYLGIQGQPVDGGHGVVTVEANSPAAKAGLQAGDVITAINGQTIDDTHPLMNLLFDHKPGDTITLTVDRNGQTLTIAVTLGTRPAQSQ